MNKQVINKLKTNFKKLFSNKLNKKTSESPEIINKKINRNKFGFPSYTNNNEENLNK
jgi:hypothetical protein